MITIRRNLSPAEIGRKTGIGSQIRQLANGTRPLSLRDMLAIARFLDDIDVLPPTDASEPLEPPGW